jgi:cytochrome c oxidase cbb3-type subunit 4
MDINVFRGIVTGVLLLLFLWLFVWAFSKARKRSFDEAARIPLDEEPRKHQPLDDEEPRK